MVKGKKVYDPITNKWSTGWWIPIYKGRHIINWLPIWSD